MKRAAVSSLSEHSPPPFLDDCCSGLRPSSDSPAHAADLSDISIPIGIATAAAPPRKEHLGVDRNTTLMLTSG